MKKLYISLGWVLLWMLATPAAYAQEEPWVMVDTKTSTLQVMQDGQVRASYDNISTGRNGVSDFRLEGDGSTPTGTFRVTWINRNSTYQLFFGLNYPNKQHAEVALRKHLIDVETYFTIVKAEYRKDVPPQHTLLGGQIGIHGLGDNDQTVHTMFNWTQGCIALTNRQIHDLDRWIRIGTMVVIR